MLLRRVRTSQPQHRVDIDWSNPITRGLVWWETPDNGKMIPSTITGAKRYPGVRGMGYGFGSSFGTTTTDIVKTQFNQHSTQRSYFGISMATGGASNLGRVFDKRSGATDSEHLLIETSAGNRLIRYGRQWATLSQWSSPVNSIVLGREFTWGISYTANANTDDPVLYVDGVPVAVTVTARAASSSVVNNTYYYTLGNRDSDKARGTIGYTTLWLVFDRLLTAAEHRSLHDNPWQIFKPRLLPAASVGAITADLSVTESNDTALAAATVELAATLAVAESNDTLSSTVAVPIAATASLTESADTISSAASVIVTATVANTDSPDTIAASGSVIVGATLAKTEAADTVFSSATAAIAATLAVTETADTVSAAASVPLSATFAANESGDSLGSAANVAISASLSVAESADTLAAAGTIIDGVNATLSVTESADTLSASASVPLSASLSYTEAADSVSGAAAVTINATATLTETGDSVSGVSVVSITATASIAESDDTLSASGTIVSGVNATLNASEASDTLAAVANAAITATLSATESGDTLAAQASVALSAALDAAEAGDTVVSSVGISVTCSASLSEDGDTLTATASIISNSNTITAASMVKLAEIWARMELDSANPLVTSATQLTVGTIAQDISTGGAVRTGATMVPTIDPDTMISEVWQRLGLDPDNALTQTNTSIDVGNIHLTVSGTDTLTVQRV